MQKIYNASIKLSICQYQGYALKILSVIVMHVAYIKKESKIIRARSKMQESNVSMQFIALLHL